MAEPKVYSMRELQIHLWTHWDATGRPCPYTKSGKWMDISEDAQIEENKPGIYNKVSVEHGWD